MKKEIKELIGVSKYFGNNKDYTLAGGGNTSFKNDDFILIKASGTALGTIDEDGFVLLDRKKVQAIRKNTFSAEEQKSDLEVNNNLISASIPSSSQKRPSVDTFLHELINYDFIVHLHPILVNALICSKKSEEMTLSLFGEEVLYIPNTSAYSLNRKLESELITYREKYGHDPQIIFLVNHGIFVGSDNIEEIKTIYESINQKIESAIGEYEDFELLELNDNIIEFIPALRMIMSVEKRKILKIRHSTLHTEFYKNNSSFQNAALPFSSDNIIYCKSAYMYIENTESPNSIINDFQSQLPDFIKTNGYPPKIIMIKDYGIVAVDDTAEDAELALDVYEYLLKICLYSRAFGGPRFLEDSEITFIENREVENYQKEISPGTDKSGLFDQRICVITGAAQGFGEALADSLAIDNANVVIADLNAEKGEIATTRIEENCNNNQVKFHRADVSDINSVRRLIKKSVELFGGIDLFISNAGILHAGSLEEMDPETFQLMTKVNYEGFFLCTKETSKIMKLQNSYNPEHFSDIIQINSKSGLVGSNRNFAYSGAKFGGIGLTQSFALELAPYKIKVNAICPGNFFEGPLWADSENGLFVQYLKAGKVPGAKNIDDIKKHYEDQVPMKRGCLAKDVMKAVKYIVDQEYETGQAVPVTGGQIMLK